MDLIDQTRALLRQELRLARAELTEKARDASSHVTSIAIGAGVAFAGVIGVMAAACTGVWAAFIAGGMSHLLAVWLAPLVVGAVVGLIGYGMIYSGVAKLRLITVVPERTAASLKETGRWMQEKVN